MSRCGHEEIALYIAIYNTDKPAIVIRQYTNVAVSELIL